MERDISKHNNYDNEVVQKNNSDSYQNNRRGMDYFHNKFQEVTSSKNKKYEAKEMLSTYSSNVLDEALLASLKSEISLTDDGKDFAFKKKELQTMELDQALKNIMGEQFVQDLNQIMEIFEEAKLKTLEDVFSFQERGGYFLIPTKKEVILDILLKNIFYVTIRKQNKIIGFCNAVSIDHDKFVSNFSDVHYKDEQGEIDYLGRYIYETHRVQKPDAKGVIQYKISEGKRVPHKKTQVVLFHEFAVRSDAPPQLGRELIKFLFASCVRKGFKVAVSQPYKIIKYSGSDKVETKLVPALTNPSVAFYLRLPAEDIGYHLNQEIRAVDGYDFTLVKLLNWYGIN